MRSLGPVSVVVVNWNGEAYLDRCLAAVAEMRGDVREVVVVDNGSTDGSLAMLARRHPKARVVRMETNAGPAAARNAGMRAAENRWVLALDNDAIVLPDLLERLALAAAADEDAAVVQPRSVFEAERDRVHYDGGSFHYAGVIALRNFYTPLAEADGKGTVEVDCFVAVAVLLDRDLVLAAGGYDGTYFILYEDLDLSYRLRALGHKILSVEDAIVLHQGGTAGISYRKGPKYPTSRVFYHSRNRWLFLAKDYRWRTLLVALPGLLAYELAWFGLAVASGGIGAWFRGKLAFARLLPQLARDRRAFQSRRSTGDRELLVAGPLTVTPSVGAGGLRRAFLRGLDLVLRGWWSLARGLAA
jgi:GT2 family glycosyltransferase